MQTRAVWVVGCFLFATLAEAAPTPADPRLKMLDAMTQELERSHTQLKMGDHPPPYFISYQVKDTEQRALGARYGAVFEDESERLRLISTDVRVGSYAFDNSMDEEHDFNFSTKGTSYLSRKNGPLDDDPAALRTALWLITDERYKAALFNYLKKKGEDVYTVTDPKRPPSFTQEPPQKYIQPPLPFGFQRARWDPLVRKLSLRLGNVPQLFDSDVKVTADRTIRSFVSTEGARLLTEDVLYGVHITAVTRADDGQLLDNSADYYAPTEAGLPTDAQLSAAADRVVDELLAIRAAPALDPYTGASWRPRVSPTTRFSPACRRPSTASPPASCAATAPQLRRARWFCCGAIRTRSCCCPRCAQSPGGAACRFSLQAGRAVRPSSDLCPHRATRSSAARSSTSR